MSDVINEPVMDVASEDANRPVDPLYGEEDVVEAFRMVFDEIILLKAALAEVLRELAEIKARS